MVLRKKITPSSVWKYMKETVEKADSTVGPRPIAIRDGNSIIGMAMYTYRNMKGYVSVATMILYNSKLQKQVTCEINFESGNLRVGDRVYYCRDKETEIVEEFAEILRIFIK